MLGGTAEIDAGRDPVAASNQSAGKKNVRQQRQRRRALLPPTMVPPSGKTAKASGASAAAAGAPAHAESPPYVTSDTHQSMEAYQRNFWQRQMARVEEQVTLPGEDTARARAGKGDSGTSAAARVAAMSRLGNEGGGSSSSSSSKGNSEKEASAAAMEAAAAAVASGKDLMELFKPQAGQLPLARIKKVMKASDDDVKVRVLENMDGHALCAA